MTKSKAKRRAEARSELTLLASDMSPAGPDDVRSMLPDFFPEPESVEVSPGLFRTIDPYAKALVGLPRGAIARALDGIEKPVSPTALAKAARRAAQTMEARAAELDEVLA